MYDGFIKFFSLQNFAKAIERKPSVESSPMAQVPTSFVWKAINGFLGFLGIITHINTDYIGFVLWGFAMTGYIGTPWNPMGSMGFNSQVPTSWLTSGFRNFKLGICWLPESLPGLVKTMDDSRVGMAGLMVKLNPKANHWLDGAKTNLVNNGISTINLKVVDGSFSPWFTGGKLHHPKVVGLGDVWAINQRQVGSVWKRLMKEGSIEVPK